MKNNYKFILFTREYREDEYVCGNLQTASVLCDFVTYASNLNARKILVYRRNIFAEIAEVCE